MNHTKHFAQPYVDALLDFLHRYLISTWYYRIEIHEIPDLLTAVLVTYDGQTDDVVEVNTNGDYGVFIARMTKIKPDWAYFKKENFEGLREQPHKTLMGWEGRTIYFARGGSNHQYWLPTTAVDDGTRLIAGSELIQGPNLAEQAKNLDALIPFGREHFKAYEDFVRICANYLFRDVLGEAKAQIRTEPGNEGLEIRDLLANNQAPQGIFFDLKQKYSASEIIFEVKNKQEISRDDLRQLYCYLKPAIGLWGFLVCRKEQLKQINAYNRTLFQNFIQTRGVLIITDNDIRKMIDMKLRDRNPSEHINEMYSQFVRGI